MRAKVGENRRLTGDKSEVQRGSVTFPRSYRR